MKWSRLIPITILDCSRGKYWLYTMVNLPLSVFIYMAKIEINVRNINLTDFSIFLHFLTIWNGPAWLLLLFWHIRFKNMDLTHDLCAPRNFFYMVNLPVGLTILIKLRLIPLSFSLKNERVPPDLNLKIKRDPAIFYFDPGPLVLLMIMLALTNIHLTWYMILLNPLGWNCSVNIAKNWKNGHIWFFAYPSAKSSI